jgi:hypothetical protein
MILFSFLSNVDSLSQIHLFIIYKDLILSRIVNNIIFINSFTLERFYYTHVSERTGKIASLISGPCVNLSVLEILDQLNYQKFFYPFHQ